jgi:histone-lysine N-methyltransferase SETD1
MGSAKTLARVEHSHSEKPDLYVANACTSVRGSKIHGWGLFAEQRFKKGDFVAEYVGEYVTNSVADAREAAYQARRIQDYQFRVDEKLVIDATLNGGNGRYINHNCNPNCISKIILGESEGGESQRRRVLFVALRDIEINEEITYDYQFPLEMNLKNRIPCNCQSDDCRGFMNWDIPEKGSNRALLIQKRGANIRDRIRRLGRPLKRDEGLNE